MAEKTFTLDEVAELISKVLDNCIVPVYMTPQQVADSLHITPDYVRNLAQQGKIKGKRNTGRWLFTPRAVRDYAENSKIVSE